MRWSEILWCGRHTEAPSQVEVVCNRNTRRAEGSYDDDLLYPSTFVRWVNAPYIDRNHSKDRKRQATRRPMLSVYRTTCPTLWLSEFSPSHLVFRRHSIKQHGGRARNFDASVLIENLVPLKTKRAGSLYLVDHGPKLSIS
jgi:hypothetical protein